MDHSCAVSGKSRSGHDASIAWIVAGILEVGGKTVFNSADACFKQFCLRSRNRDPATRGPFACWGLCCLDYASSRDGFQTSNEDRFRHLRVSV